MRHSLPHRSRRSLACVLAILSIALSSSGCTTLPPSVTPAPEPVIPIPPPAECLKSALETTPESLAPLPDDFQTQGTKQQAETLIALKLTDAMTYKALRDTAIRCSS